MPQTGLTNVASGAFVATEGAMSRPRSKASTPTIATSAISPGVLAPASGPAGACNRASADSSMPRSAHRRRAAHRPCAGWRSSEHARAGLAQRRLPAPPRRPRPGSRRARSARSAGCRASRMRKPLGQEARLVGGRGSAQHAQARRAGAAGLDEELDRAVARAATWRAARCPSSGIGLLVADAHELRQAARHGAAGRRPTTTPLAQPPPIHPCSVPSARTMACAPT